jgi:hypothetical protein
MSSPSDGFSELSPLDLGLLSLQNRKKAVSIIEAAHGLMFSTRLFGPVYGQTSPPFMFFHHQHQNLKCLLPMKTPITRVLVF